MPETLVIQNNFSAGELSPRLYGRSDHVKYRNGLKTQLNLITQKHGGLLRRSGTRFAAETKDSAAGIDRKARMIEFQFSTQQTYQLEFGHQYIRFFRDRGALLHGTVHGVTNATEAAGTATITIGGHAILVGDQISVKGILTDDPAFKIGYDGTFAVTATTATTVSYAISPAPPGVYSSGGTVTKIVGNTPTEIVTPYTDANDLDLIKVAQSADVLFISHPNHEPRLLKRTPGSDHDPSVWNLATLDAQDGPYLPFNTKATATITIAAGAADATVAITLSNAAVAEINDGQGLLSTDVGRTFSWIDAGIVRWGEIATRTDRQNGTILLKAASTGLAVDEWRFGVWNDRDGWPFCVTFHEDRLSWGGSDALPQTIWLSATGDFTNYADRETDNTVVADGAVVLTINDDRVNTIHWIISDDRGLIVHTDGGGFIASPAGSEPISAVTPPLVKRQMTEPASREAQPHRINGVVLTPASGDRKVFEFIYAFDIDRYISNDLAILSEHITIGGITDTALQFEPDNIMWMVRNDGTLLAMTYERAENVVAWSRHVLGGTLTGEAQPAVESVGVIRDGSDDLVWLIVKRTINGQTKRYVEFIEAIFDADDITEDGFFVDSGLTLDSPGEAITGATQANPVVITVVGHGLSTGDRIRIRDVKGMTELNNLSYLVGATTATEVELNDLTDSAVDGTAFTAYVSGGNVYREVQQVLGLTHLIGETVTILADGATHPDKVVDSSGEITLERFASVVQVGLAYTYRMTTLPLVAATQFEARGRTMRVSHVTARFNRSLGGLLGDTIKDPIVHRTSSVPMGQPTPLFSGRKKLPVSGRHDQDVTATLEGSQPLPMNLLSLEIEVVVEGI